MIKLINRKENIYGDNIGFVEYYDFSKANVDEKSRINAITTVASICYQSPKALNSEVLFNRLMSESIGLPSSSFEFIPVLLDLTKHEHRLISKYKYIKRHSLLIDSKWLLTNYRAIVYDYETHKEYISIDPREIFNTKEEEIEIIKKHFKVFLFKTDLNTRSQAIRHRVNWQELSRRYVSGKRVEFEFFISDKMKEVVTDGHTTQDIINLCVKHYNNALDHHIKPEEARRIIPQAMYTQYWGGFMSDYLDNFYKLRLDKHAQKEIRMLAETMKELEC